MIIFSIFLIIFLLFSLYFNKRIKIFSQPNHSYGWRDMPIDFLIRKQKNIKKYIKAKGFYIINKN